MTGVPPEPFGLTSRRFMMCTTGASNNQCSDFKRRLQTPSVYEARSVCEGDRFGSQNTRPSTSHSCRSLSLAAPKISSTLAQRIDNPCVYPPVRSLFLFLTILPAGCHCVSQVVETVSLSSHQQQSFTTKRDHHHHLQIFLSHLHRPYTLHLTDTQQK